MSKKIIIVGATSGIGRKIAEIYLEKGNKVGVTGRREHLLQELMGKFPNQVETECFDVTKDKNIFHLESLITKLGGLDILIISAGIGEPSIELKWEIDKKTVLTNVYGFIEIANWAFNFFVKQGYGQLAVISSIAANGPSSRAASYSASKSFQSIYAEGLSLKARRLKKKIFVTCVEPGFVNTKIPQTKNPFWVIPVEKAARQIINAIHKKKRKVYISKRWWIIAKMIRWMPYFIYKRLA